MREGLLVIVLAVFFCLGYPAMKRLDRFLNEHLRDAEDQTEKTEPRSGKKH